MIGILYRIMFVVGFLVLLVYFPFALEVIYVILE
jgi:hypothetical protein